MGMSAREVRERLSLYLVTDPVLCPGHVLLEKVTAAVRGGATLVQLRDKSATTAARIEKARALIAALEGSGVPLVVNDDVEAAIASGAAGVHIGQGDGDVRALRERIGAERLLGLSCETRAHVLAVPDACVDYLGLGPVFGTATKPGHAPPVGMAGLGEMVAASPLPTVAIGGLSSEHVGAVRRAGADGVAVVSALLASEHVEAAAAGFSMSLTQAHGEAGA